MRANLRRSLVTTALSVASLAGGSFLLATPAMALGSDCQYIGPRWCQSATVPVTSSHEMRMTAWYNGTTCYMYDSVNGNEVGRVTSTGTYKNKTVPGLYGSYFITCYRATNSPDGYIWNGS